jgi:hypothetical protein
VIYFKSALAGIVTLVIGTALYGAVIYARLQVHLWTLRHANPGDTYFVVEHFHFFDLPSLVTAIAVFLCGSYWMFRRLHTQQ